MRRLAVLSVTLALVGVACVPPPPPGNISAVTVLGHIRVANPNFAGYQRTLFHYPQDADHDHCDTRAEVLLRDSATPVAATPFCTVVSGRWTSAYDGVTTTSAAALQIDHVVALAEAWASGASNWTEARRTAYGNDLTDRRTLREVTIAANEIKSDLDPAHWLPQLASDRCPYIGDHLERPLMRIDPAAPTAITIGPAAAKWVSGGSHRWKRSTSDSAGRPQPGDTGHGRPRLFPADIGRLRSERSVRPVGSRSPLPRHSARVAGGVASRGGGIETRQERLRSSQHGWCQGAPVSASTGSRRLSNGLTTAEGFAE